MKKPFYLATLLLIGATSVAGAQQTASDVVPFTATVGAVCTLTVDNGGTMTANPALTLLSSKNAGGQPGQVTIQASTADFSIHAEAPSAFAAAPATGGDNVTFAAFYSLAGGTSLGETPGATVTPLAAGETVMTVNLDANKATGTFIDGAYQADVNVVCE